LPEKHPNLEGQSVHYSLDPAGECPVSDQHQPIETEVAFLSKNPGDKRFELGTGLVCKKCGVPLMVPKDLGPVTD
jgi:hypothetical protein